MTDLLILGTDTGAGKTTFAALWLVAFGDGFAYWKPVETGASDTESVRGLVPEAAALDPAARYHKPVTPLLAARLEGTRVPSATELAASRPKVDGKALLIETFGSPLSPLTETELQLSLIHRLACATILVSSSALGAIGRTLQTLHALASHDVHPVAIVLMGDPDPFAAEQISTHWHPVPVFSLQPPRNWDAASVKQTALDQEAVLLAIANRIPPRQPPAPMQGARAEATSLASWEAKKQAWARGFVDRDRASVWHPYTSLRDPDLPLVCTGAEAEFLEVEPGGRVIDGISSWWTILHGHRHPALMTALREATRAYDHVHFAGLTHPAGVELAELLLRTAPWRNGKVFYSDNGSTAVEVALKMAYQFWCHRGEPGRTCFVGLEGGYHGDTFGAMAVSRDPVFFGRFEPLLFRAEIVPVSAERLDEVLSRRKNQVAAVIVEPLVQGAGGFRMHTPAELRGLYEAARRHGVLFITDEAMTGGGRTGTLWAHQAAGIVPDLICAAKTLAGGVLPLAATLASPEVVAAWDTDDRTRTFFHGHSFTAQPLACAVAVANWKLLTAGPLAAPQRIERFWQAALSPVRGQRPVKDVRIRGSIAAIELDLPGGYLAAAGRDMRQYCLQQGVLLRPLGSVLYALPPYCTSDDSLERIAAAMKGAVSRMKS
jgi:adenosylmethionine---8-amino-7-oxononanoate aminotransferase